ncbi:hypothetical protein [Lysobacter claricitrinus]|uniref:hypothetical protein n=1 Tax=Lysobacter claricitrinus TaxID=3367728 RepID=UPI0037DAE841
MVKSAALAIAFWIALTSPAQAGVPTHGLCTPDDASSDPNGKWENILLCVFDALPWQGDTRDRAGIERLNILLEANRAAIGDGLYFYWKGQLALLADNKPGHDVYLEKAAALQQPAALFEEFKLTGDRRFLIKAAAAGSYDAAETLAFEEKDPRKVARQLENLALRGYVQGIEGLDTRLEYLPVERRDFWRLVFALVGTGEYKGAYPGPSADWSSICRIAALHPKPLERQRPLKGLEHAEFDAAMLYLERCVAPSGQPQVPDGG